MGICQWAHLWDLLDLHHCFDSCRFAKPQTGPGLSRYYFLQRWAGAFFFLAHYRARDFQQDRLRCRANSSLPNRLYYIRTFADFTSPPCTLPASDWLFALPIFRVLKKYAIAILFWMYSYQCNSAQVPTSVILPSGCRNASSVLWSIG